MWKEIESWFWRLRNRIEWRLNQRLLGRPGYAACDRCRWVFPILELIDGLCPGCDAWYAHKRYLEEEERRIQEEIDAVWEERRAELDSQPCSICGHPEGHHYASGCDDCPEGYSCGDPDSDSELDPEEFTEVWFTEPPGGHHGYE